MKKQRPNLMGRVMNICCLRISVVCLLACVFCMEASAQTRKSATLDLPQASIQEVLQAIESQTDYRFTYGQDVKELLTSVVSVRENNQEVSKILQKILAPAGLTYAIQGQQIAISKNVRSTKAAQTISGTIISSTDNKPIAGVSVYAEGTVAGTISNIDGSYQLRVPAGVKYITFQFLGYDLKKISTADYELFKLVSLVEQNNAIDDVVVVGYGTQKKESMVSSITAVKPSDLTITSSSLTTAFAGNIAGVISQQHGGEPGYDGASYTIRGVSTFGYSNDPLIIMDGVEITSRMLNNLPPEAIESFSVLKDASATALYGTRGANGVILVNTKSGRNSEKMNVTVRLENTFSMPTSVQDIADGVTYMNLYNEAVYNGAVANNTAYTPFYSDDKIYGTIYKRNKYLYPNNNWYDMLFKDFTVNQNLNLSIRGGSKKVDYFLNAAVSNENGIIKEPEQNPYDVKMNHQKYIFQSNVNAYITKTTKVGVRINAQLEYNTRPNEDISDLFYYTMRANPVRFPATLPGEEGDTYVRYGNNDSWDTGSTDLNPLALLARGYGKRYYSFLTSAFTIDQDLGFFTKGLSVQLLASFYNYTYTGTYRYATPFYYKVNEDMTTQNPDGSYNIGYETAGGIGSTYLTSTTGHDGHHKYALQGSINYSRTFGKHDVNVMLVYHQNEKVNNILTSDKESTLLPFREQGLSGRATYAFDKRFMVEANFGYNGSENFAPGKRWGFFPSVAGGWVISNESFWKPLRSTVSNLKVRASYGVSGNDALSDRFPYLTTVSMSESSSFYQGTNWSQPTGPKIEFRGNEEATWEKARKLDIGIDIGLFNNLTIEADAFWEDRTGIFMKRASLPSSVGVTGTTPYSNIGRVKSKGFDLSAVYDRRFNKDWALTLRGTLTFSKNRVVEKDEGSKLYAYTMAKGQPVNTIFGYIAEGLFTSQEEIDNSPRQTFGSYTVGDIKYRDLNGDGVVDGNDITAIGNPTIPEIQYGIAATVKWRKLDFSVMFQGAGRVSLHMYNMFPFCDASHYGYNIVQYIADDHWSENNNRADAAFPRLTSTQSDNNTKTSTFYVKDARYLRLKNAEIGYSIKKFRVYVSGSNLFILSPFKYWDPEKGNGNGLSYPLQRTVKLGVQYQF